MPDLSRRVLTRRLLAFALVLCTSALQARTPITVAAASDLEFALKEIAARFEADTGQDIRLVFGSSGTFYSQIRQGAPFDMFLSADEAFVFRLAATGRTADEGRLYAYGRIGLFVPHGAPLVADAELADLGAALADGRLRKFAIANPEHAPYGMRAKEALQHAGLWDRIETHLVLGENIAQAAQFAASGSTQGGIVALSLALSPAFSDSGTFALIPESWHQRMAQRMVVLNGAHRDAHRFYDYIAGDAARSILQRYGFILPGE